MLAASQLRPLAHRRAGLAGAVDPVRPARGGGARDRARPRRPRTLLRGFVLGEDDRIDDRTPRSLQALRARAPAGGLAVRTSSCSRSSAPRSARSLGVSLRGRLLVVLGADRALRSRSPAPGRRSSAPGSWARRESSRRSPGGRRVALVRAAARRRRHARAQPARRRRHRLAAQLRRGRSGSSCSARRSRALLAGSDPGRARRAIAEAAALTISATLATAPLTSFHFETLSLVALPANLLAVPAEAPVMWLGMLAAAAGQVGVAPGRAAHRRSPGCSPPTSTRSPPGPRRRRWAQVDLGVGGLVALAAVYVALGAGLGLRTALGAAAACGLRPPGAPAAAGPLASGRRGAVVAGCRRDRGCRPPPSLPAAGDDGRRGGLRVDVLDVGQGDAILLRPPTAPAVLVDAGPPGSDRGRSSRRARGRASWARW